MMAEWFFTVKHQIKQIVNTTIDTEDLGKRIYPGKKTDISFIYHNTILLCEKIRI